MQSGAAGTTHWVMEFEPRVAPFMDFLMGWTGSIDPLDQPRMTFPTKEAALAFARRQGWTASVSQPHGTHLPPRSYADNFTGPFDEQS